MTTKPGFIAVSNAPEQGKPLSAGKLVKHRFAPTEPLPTYLVAFVTGPFVTVQGTVPATPQRPKPLPLRIVGTKPYAGQMAYALEGSKKIVALLEHYFDQPFPYPKLDQIGSPVMPGAMENAGADIYGDGILFVDEDSPTEDKQTFGMVVAHELSHQWFGDVVTPAWWDDIWLNESFANWMGYRIGNEWRPDLNIGVSAIDEAFDAMQIDALGRRAPDPREDHQRRQYRRGVRPDHLWQGRPGGGDDRRLSGRGEVPRRRAAAHAALPSRQRHHRPVLRFTRRAPRTIRACWRRSGASSISRACRW